MTEADPTGVAWHAFSGWMSAIEAALDGDTDEVDVTTWTEWYAEGLNPERAASRYRAAWEGQCP